MIKLMAKSAFVGIGSFIFIIFLSKYTAIFINWIFDLHENPMTAGEGFCVVTIGFLVGVFIFSKDWNRHLL